MVDARSLDGLGKDRYFFRGAGLGNFLGNEILLSQQQSTPKTFLGSIRLQLFLGLVATCGDFQDWVPQTAYSQPHLCMKPSSWRCTLASLQA